MNDLRVLIVDDEKSILSALERGLEEDFTITCSQSATEAIEILKQSRDFAVVVTDMRMPEVDGLQFIQRAREVAPDCVYIMLTGNQDLKTVVQATNDGHVFRYLTKPCPLDELSTALQAGLDKFLTAESERALLKSTFAGVFDVMIELLTASHPVISAISERVKLLNRLTCNDLKWPESWEATVASRMSMVGFTVLPEQVSKELVDTTKPFTQETFAALQQGLQTSRRLMSKIPRLGRVCNIIDAMCGNDDRVESDHASYGLLLGMTIVYTLASRKDGGDTINAVLTSYPNASPILMEALQKSDKTFLAGSKSSEKVAIQDLTAGMVLADDLLIDGTTPVLRCGDVITDCLRDHLRTFSSLPEQVSTYTYG
jgi:CheY-like chemotaxis protein